MAIALCNASGVSPQNQDFAIILQTIYVGLDIEGTWSWEVIVVVPVDSDSDGVHTAMRDAVLADATERGYPLEAADITLPVFRRG
jgi:hypothetical protein